MLINYLVDEIFEFMAVHELALVYELSQFMAVHEQPKCMSKFQSSWTE